MNKKDINEEIRNLNQRYNFLGKLLNEDLLDNQSYSDLSKKILDVRSYLVKMKSWSAFQEGDFKPKKIKVYVLNPYEEKGFKFVAGNINKRRFAKIVHFLHIPFRAESDIYTSAYDTGNQEDIKWAKENEGMIGKFNQTGLAYAFTFEEVEKDILEVADRLSK